MMFDRMMEDYKSITGCKENDSLLIYSFMQTWPNTGGGFAEPGYVYGQAFTDQRTTVIMAENEGTSVVFFDGTPAYVVSLATDVFVDDINSKKIVSVGAAIGRYNARSIQ